MDFLVTIYINVKNVRELFEQSSATRSPPFIYTFPMLLDQSENVKWESRYSVRTGRAFTSFVINPVQNEKR